MTQANYRTEIQVLKMAQKRETCFAICNICYALLFHDSKYVQ